jgi:Uma2 family endonuclease
MATAVETSGPETLADLLHRIGDVAPERILVKPPPGTATVRDVIAALEGPRKRICELVDGVLVEKTMAAKESILAIRLSRFVGTYLDGLDYDLGVLLGEAGTLEMLPQLVRIPDLCFVSWERVGADEWPEEPAPEIVPNLAVEVISQSNTKAEMTRKLRDYFEAGVEEVWYIYPKTQSIEVYSSPTKVRRISKDGTLTASVVFPGFSLPLSKLFASTRRSKKR